METVVPSPILVVELDQDQPSRRKSHLEWPTTTEINQLNGSATGKEEELPNIAAAVLPNLQETMCMLQMISAEGPLAKLSKKKPVMSGISMPGISNIFGSAHLSRRIVWTVVVVTAITVATIQVNSYFITS